MKKVKWISNTLKKDKDDIYRPEQSMIEPTIASLRIRAIEALIKQNHYQNLDILFEHAEKITAYCLGILKNEQ